MPCPADLVPDPPLIDFSPPVCIIATSSCVCQAKEIAKYVDHPPTSHTFMLETKMSTTHRHEWRINLGCSDTLPPHHHSHHTLRMWWASSAASLSHSNHLSNFALAPPSPSVEESIVSDGLAEPAVLRPMQILTIAHAAQLRVVWHVVCVCACACVHVCVRVCVRVRVCVCVCV